MQPTVDKPISPDSRIIVSPSDSPGWKESTDAIASPDPLVREISFAAANSSTKSVMAMAVIWEVRTFSGDKRVNKFLADNYLLSSPHALIPAGSSVLVLPYLVLRFEHVRSAAAYQQPLRQWGRDFRDAAEIQVRIDSVIFEDGEVIGTNVYRLDETIKARKAAAKVLAALVRQTLARGDSPKELLSAIASSAVRRSDKMHIWQRRFAHQLLDSSNLEGTLRYLERLPVPPKFVLHNPANQ